MAIDITSHARAARLKESRLSTVHQTTNNLLGNRTAAVFGIVFRVVAMAGVQLVT